jgi:ADP-ribose pyrophosphatase YjhB (NUDIX family)
MASVSGVRTAGVLLRHGDDFVFQLGPNHDGTALGVARLGGHLEPGETAAACARREVLEEASVEIDILDPPDTFGYQAGARPIRLIETAPGTEQPRPLLVGRRDGQISSLTYLARATARPEPRAESHALVFLRAEEVALVCEEPVTIRQLLEAGGRFTTGRPLPMDAPLQPLDQLLALTRLLSAGTVPGQR